MTYTDEHIKEAMRFTGINSPVDTIKTCSHRFPVTLAIAGILAERDEALAERDEALAKLAKYEPQVDPDLVLADEVCALAMEAAGNGTDARNYRTGKIRCMPRWQDTFAGIKAGREAERREDGK